MPLTENQRRASSAGSKFSVYLIEQKEKHGLGIVPTDSIMAMSDAVGTIVERVLEDMMPTETMTTSTTSARRLLTEFDPSRVERKLEEVKDTYETGLAKVRQPDGSPMYAPDIQREKEAAVAATYKQATDAIVTDLEAKIAEAEAELKTLGREPLFRLKSDELARAGQLQPFIAEEAERLDVKHLVELAEAAIVAKDRVLQVLYHRQLRFKAEAANQQRTAATGGQLPRHASEAIGTLAPVIDQLSTLLADPLDDERRKRAEANIEAARKIRTGIVTKSLTEQYLKQAYSRVHANY